MECAGFMKLKEESDLEESPIEMNHDGSGDNRDQKADDVNCCRGICDRMTPVSSRKPLLSGVTTYKMKWSVWCLLTLLFVSCILVRHFVDLEHVAAMRKHDNGTVVSISHHHM